jgi:hypothetical protein
MAVCYLMTATAKQNIGVKRCQKIPKLFRSFERPIQIGVSLVLLATANVATTKAKPVKEIVFSAQQSPQWTV